jgi:hypothetical protein
MPRSAANVPSSAQRSAVKEPRRCPSGSGGETRPSISGKSSPGIIPFATPPRNTSVRSDRVVQGDRLSHVPDEHQGVADTGSAAAHLPSKQLKNPSPGPNWIEGARRAGRPAPRTPRFALGFGSAIGRRRFLVGADGWHIDERCECRGRGPRRRRGRLMAGMPLPASAGPQRQCL